MNYRLYASATALLLAVCTAHAADTGQPETQTASEADIPLKERNYPQERKHPADKAKIARNMAAWDKLMASPEQQPPNTEKYRKTAEKNRLFTKHAVPLMLIQPVSDKDIESIEINYAGMHLEPTDMHVVRTFEVRNLSDYLSYGPDSNRLLEEKEFMKGDTANFRLPPERFGEFVSMLNNIRVWKYPNPASNESMQHRLMIAVTYKNGRIWVLGANYRYRYENHLSAMVTRELLPSKDGYDFVYISLRDIVLLMQHLDDRVPVFLYRYDDELAQIRNELKQWKEILENMNHTKKPADAKQSQPHR